MKQNPSPFTGHTLPIYWASIRFAPDLRTAISPFTGQVSAISTNPDAQNLGTFLDLPGTRACCIGSEIASQSTVGLGGLNSLAWMEAIR